MADLQHVLRDLLLRSGLEAVQFDVSSICGVLHGVRLGERTPIFEAVSQLQQLFQLDAIEDNGVLKFVHRGKAASAEILEDQTIDGIAIERLAELNLPEQLDVVHIDPQADYQASVQTALRQTGFSKDKQSLRTSIALDSRVANQQANTLLEASWVERFRFKFQLPVAFLALQVGDVVDLVLSTEKRFGVRLIKVLFQENMLEIEAVSTLAAAYEQQGQAVDLATDSQVRRAGESTLYLLDIPLVNDSSDQSVYYMAVTKPFDDNVWQYATVYEGESEQSLAPKTVVTQEAIAGRSLTGLDAPISSVYLDMLHTVEVVLDDGQLESVEKSELLQGANSAVLGDEILQFQFAELIGLRTYRLSGLLRGRRGTEWAMQHSINERFVLLGDEVQQIATTPDQLQVERVYKAVSSGQLLDDSKEVAFTPVGVNLKPYAPVHLSVERQGDDLLISWVRRTRFGGGWQGNVDAVLAEAVEAYDLEIYNGGTLLRTVSVSEQSFRYEAVMQTADTGGVLSEVDVVVYQVSAAVGRGYGASLTS